MPDDQFPALVHDGEILFDLDIKAKQKADQLGLRFERPPALNDDPLYIDTLETVIRRRLKDW